MSRQPGTQEGRTKEKGLDLKGLGLSVAPGVNCAACGQELSLHADADCLVVMSNALKQLTREVARLQMIEVAASEFTTCPTPLIGTKYRELVIVLAGDLTGE